MKIAAVAIFAVLLISCKKDSTNSSIPKKLTVYIGGDGYVANQSVPLYWKNGTEILFERDSPHTINGMAVSNGDIYLCGEVLISPGLYKASYWKNGNRIDLTDGKSLASATAIMILENDVYVCGVEHDTAKYWKNGKPFTLLGHAVARSIAVSGNDLYIAGTDVHTLSSNAIYWKNGKKIILPKTGYSSAATKIILVGNDEYIAGVDDERAVYWKNGSEIFVGDGTASGIAVSGSNVYVVGESVVSNKGIAKCWKNGVDIPIVDSASTGSRASDVAVNDNDVYIVGEDSGPIFEPGKNHSKVWKNGVEEPLPQFYDWEIAVGIVIK